ncbi:hypothetical protein KI387_004180 [Taxus chinensis]|uniref:RING-type E3 ubiquitin transferase n=1 Tax=Taxus chinensis TaxID=29808 RepID=A0AA38H2U6_TAXCH|nr:hypothetical protein KI387_004180 [Taxus chinensis]
MAPGMNVNVAKQAELLKQEGNTYFKKERLVAAIEAYTQAITLCPNVPAYWTNRALCHRKRYDWEKVEADCRKALELDTSSVKAYYMLGLALLQRKQYAGGVKLLQKALELGRGANPSSYMVEEIWQELAKARYLEWESASSVRLKKQQELRVICERALQREHESTVIQSSQSNILPPLTAEWPNWSRKSTNDGDMESTDLEGESVSCQNSINLDLGNVYKERCEILSDVFNKAAEADIPSEVPMKEGTLNAHLMDFPFVCCGNGKGQSNRSHLCNLEKRFQYNQPQPIWEKLLATNRAYKLFDVSIYSTLCSNAHLHQTIFLAFRRGVRSQVSFFMREEYSSSMAEIPLKELPEASLKDCGSEVEAKKEWGPTKSEQLRLISEVISN